MAYNKYEPITTTDYARIEATNTVQELVSRTNFSLTDATKTLQILAAFRDAFQQADSLNANQQFYVSDDGQSFILKDPSNQENIQIQTVPPLVEFDTNSDSLVIKDSLFDTSNIGIGNYLTLFLPTLTSEVTSKNLVIPNGTGTVNLSITDSNNDSYRNLSRDILVVKRTSDTAIELIHKINQEDEDTMTFRTSFLRDSSTVEVIGDVPNFEIGTKIVSLLTPNGLVSNVADGKIVISGKEYELRLGGTETDPIVPSTIELAIINVIYDTVAGVVRVVNTSINRLASRYIIDLIPERVVYSNSWVSPPTEPVVELDLGTYDSIQTKRYYIFKIEADLNKQALQEMEIRVEISGGISSPTVKISATSSIDILNIRVQPYYHIDGNDVTLRVVLLNTENGILPNSALSISQVILASDISIDSELVSSSEIAFDEPTVGTKIRVNLLTGFKYLYQLTNYDTNRPFTEDDIKDLTYQEAFRKLRDNLPNGSSLQLYISDNYLPNLLPKAGTEGSFLMVADSRDNFFSLVFLDNLANAEYFTSGTNSLVHEYKNFETSIDGPIGDANLNTMTGKGYFTQEDITEVSEARNYPSINIGALSVISLTGDFVTQSYTDQDSKVHVRSSVDKGANWSNWNKIIDYTDAMLILEDHQERSYTSVESLDFVDANFAGLSFDNIIISLLSKIISLDPTRAGRLKTSFNPSDSPNLAIAMLGKFGEIGTLELAVVEESSTGVNLLMPNPISFYPLSGDGVWVGSYSDGRIHGLTQPVLFSHIEELRSRTTLYTLRSLEDIGLTDTDFNSFHKSDYLPQTALIYQNMQPGTILKITSTNSQNFALGNAFNPGPDDEDYPGDYTFSKPFSSSNDLDVVNHFEVCYFSNASDLKSGYLDFLGNKWVGFLTDDYKLTVDEELLKLSTAVANVTSPVGTIISRENVVPNGGFLFGTWEQMSMTDGYSLVSNSNPTPGALTSGENRAHTHTTSFNGAIDDTITSSSAGGHSHTVTVLDDSHSHTVSPSVITLNNLIRMSISTTNETNRDIVTPSLDPNASAASVAWQYISQNYNGETNGRLGLYFGQQSHLLPNNTAWQETHNHGTTVSTHSGHSHTTRVFEPAHRHDVESQGGTANLAAGYQVAFYKRTA